MSNRYNIWDHLEASLQTSKMSLFDRLHFLTYVKWFAFSMCTLGFLWKVSDSVANYIAGNIGTKTDLKANYEAEVPGLAVCRHPNQITTLWDEDTYNLTLAELRYLKAYQVHPQEGLEPIFDKFVFNDSSSVVGVTISERGSYSRVSEPSLISRPRIDSAEWHSFFHPLYGVCWEFSPSKNIRDLVGSAGIEYIKVNVDFVKAFPHLPKEEVEEAAENKTSSQLQKEIMNRYGEHNVLVVLYDRGSFLTSHQVVTLTREEDEKLSLEQEVVDKTRTKKVARCRSYDDEMTEDDCLNDCLARTFIQEFGCLHVRLRKMSLKNETLKLAKQCLLEDVEKKTKEYEEKVNKGSKSRFPRAVEEFGVVRIRQILAAFNQDDGLERCGCPMKCRRRVITLTKIPHESTRDLNKKNRRRGFAYFNIQPYLKIYSYHILYTGSDLVADIGGYLGLFLGLSVFGLVEFMETIILKRKEAKAGSSTNSNNQLEDGNDVVKDS